MLKSILFIPIFFVANAYAQDWQKQKNNKKIDSINAIYSWEWHDAHHGAYGNLILSKSGRFHYSALLPIAFSQFSEGIYTIRKDTLILNSDLQPDNMSIKIEYVDSLNIDSSYDRLPFPKNLNGITMDAYYLINNDSTDNGMFIPDDNFTRNYRKRIDSIYSLKVQINQADFGSTWIPIQKNNKFIRVVVLTERDLHDYKPLVITNYKLLIKGKKLIDISNSKNPL